MANTIGLISQYGAENLDEVFVRESCTGILENQGGLKLRPAAQKCKNCIYTRYGIIRIRRL